MEPRWRFFFASVLLGIAAIVGGCGGGESSEPALTTSSLNQAAYVKKVNAICVNMVKTAFEGMKRVGTEPIASSAPGKAMKQVWAPALRAEAEEIRTLGAPSGDATKIEAYLVALGKAAEEVEIKEPTEILLLEKLLKPVDRPAGAYGLEKCEF